MYGLILMREHPWFRVMVFCLQAEKGQFRVLYLGIRIEIVLRPDVEGDAPDLLFRIPVVETRVAVIPEVDAHDLFPGMQIYVTAQPVCFVYVDCDRHIA